MYIYMYIYINIFAYVFISSHIIICYDYDVFKQPHQERLQGTTLPETNIAPENRPSQKETIVFQPSILRCYVSFKEGIQYHTKVDLLVSPSDVTFWRRTTKEMFFEDGATPGGTASKNRI